MELVTPRLKLRQWRDADREPFARLNADPVTMEFFPSVLDRSASDAIVERCRAHIEERGWGNWAVELAATGEFIGFVGLSVPRHAFHFSPCVEIGWRVHRDHWGKGYATEAAREALRAGFEELALGEIVSLTALGNVRSRRVMERIGMRDAHEDFDHPAIPEGHALRRHCLYRLARKEWLARRG